jgi:hypothetical protein
MLQLTRSAVDPRKHASENWIGRTNRRVAGETVATLGNCPYAEAASADLWRVLCNR